MPKGSDLREKTTKQIVMDPTEITGAGGEKIRLRYEHRPETWTQKELSIEILRVLREIRDNQNKVTFDKSFVLPKADPTQRKG